MSQRCSICLAVFDNTRRKYCDIDCSRVALISRKPWLLRDNKLLGEALIRVRQKQSVNKLFDEDFTPVWEMNVKNELHNLDSDLEAAMEFGYRQYAKSRMDSILSNTKGVMYSNPSK